MSYGGRSCIYGLANVTPTVDGRAVQSRRSELARDPLLPGSPGDRQQAGSYNGWRTVSYGGRSCVYGLANVTHTVDGRAVQSRRSQLAGDPPLPGSPVIASKLAPTRGGAGHVVLREVQCLRLVGCHAHSRRRGVPYRRSQLAGDPLLLGGPGDRQQAGSYGRGRRPGARRQERGAPTLDYCLPLGACVAAWLRGCVGDG